MPRMNLRFGWPDLDRHDSASFTMFMLSYDSRRPHPVDPPGYPPGRTPAGEHSGRNEPGSITGCVGVDDCKSPPGALSETGAGEGLIEMTLPNKPPAAARNIVSCRRKGGGGKGVWSRWLTPGRACPSVDVYQHVVYVNQVLVTYWCGSCSF